MIDMFFFGKATGSFGREGLDFKRNPWCAKTMRP